MERLPDGNFLTNQRIVTVATLVGHRDASMAKLCLGSLSDMCRQPLRFRIHDDGSLTEMDKSQLAMRLRQVEFVDRREADAHMAAHLSRYPACRAMRERQVYGLKLFDVPLLATETEIAFCDSDILFLRPFEGLFEWPDEATNCIFMQDWQEAYAIRSWHLLPGSRVKLPQRLNCGLFFLRRARYDIEIFEKLIAWDCAAFHRLPWLEQTCWGHFAMQRGGRFWDERLVRVIRNEQSLDDDLVAGHFTSPVRGLLSLAGTRMNFDRATVRIATEPMRLLGPARHALDTIGRFFRTRFSRQL